LKANPEEMASEAEHQEVSKEHATEETGKAPSKQHRDQHLAAGCSIKPKELTRVDQGSRRKLAATCRKVPRHARVAWHKAIAIRKNWTRTKVEQVTWRAGPLRKSLQTHHEGGRGKKDLGGKQSLYMRKKRQPQSASEGGAQDSYHLWEEEQQPTRPSRRPLNLEFMQ
jgi:hypothetical protein